MKLHVIGSSSAGNCYILRASTGEALMVECGRKWFEIQEAINFDIRAIVGCLVTHSHKDHCAAVQNVLKSGIEVYATEKEHEAMGTIKSRRASVIRNEDVFCIGSFDVHSFSIIHDTPDPVGYLIRHPEMGVVLFLTDTIYSPYKFNGLNQVIVEANYCQKILDARMAASENPAFLRDRVIQSHMSIENCKDLLRANDLSQVNNIVLIHLSNNNSHADRFQNEVEELTGKTVTVADSGMIIPFDKSPF